MSEKDLPPSFELACLAIAKHTEIDLNESSEEKSARIERLQNDYAAFFEYYFPMYATAPTAEFHVRIANAMRNNKNFKGIFEAFRGSAKSTHADIGIPFWLMVLGELKCMILVGQTEEKAIRLLAGLQAQLHSNRRIIHDYGKQVSSNRWKLGEFVTRTGCAFYALGMGQSPRGTRSEEHRPDLIIMDDCDSKKLNKNPSLVREAVEWALDDLMGCMDIGRERFLIVNNRISKHSILAHLHDMMVAKKDEKYRWYHLKVNALDEHGESTWVEKYSNAYWHEKKEMLVLRSWEREYMNNPIEEGTVFKHEWIKWKEMLPLHEYEKLVVYVDPSFKNTKHSDFKAVKFWGKRGKELHLIDAFVRRTDIQVMVNYLYDLYSSIPNDVIVDFYMETNFLQDIIMSEIDKVGRERNLQLPIREDRRKKPDKYKRIEATAPYYERGCVFYSQEKMNDPDFATAIEQLLATEPGSRAPDDSPDADEGAIYMLLHKPNVTLDAIIGERERKYNY